MTRILATTAAALMITTSLAIAQSQSDPAGRPILQQGISSTTLGDGKPAQGISSTTLGDGKPAQGISSTTLGDGKPAQGINSSGAAKPAEGITQKK